MLLLPLGVAGIKVIVLVNVVHLVIATSSDFDATPPAESRLIMDSVMLSDPPSPAKAVLLDSSTGPSDVEVLMPKAVVLGCIAEVAVGRVFDVGIGAATAKDVRSSTA